MRETRLMPPESIVVAYVWRRRWEVMGSGVDKPRQASFRAAVTIAEALQAAKKPKGARVERHEPFGIEFSERDFEEVVAASIYAHATVGQQAELADAKACVAHEEQAELKAVARGAQALLQDAVDIGWNGSGQVERELG